MATNASQFSDSKILAQVIVPERGDFSFDAARSVRQWKFAQEAIERINVLAERNAQGLITEAEQEELRNYLRVGSLINLVHAKARLSLSDSGKSEP